MMHEFHYVYSMMDVFQYVERMHEFQYVDRMYDVCVHIACKLSGYIPSGLLRKTSIYSLDLNYDLSPTPTPPQWMQC